jgi:hypothetical protein
MGASFEFRNNYIKQNTRHRNVDKRYIPDVQQVLVLITYVYFTIRCYAILLNDVYTSVYLYTYAMSQRK